MTPIYLTKTAGFLEAITALRSSPLAGAVMARSISGVIKTAADGVTREEKRNIRKTLKVIKPRSRTEEQVQEIAGRPLTKGQIIRRGLIGAGGGIGLGVAHGLITKQPLTVGRAVSKKVMSREAAKGLATFSPQRLLSGAATGSVFGLGIPLVQRQADIEAARRGQF